MNKQRNIDLCVSYVYWLTFLCVVRKHSELCLEFMRAVRLKNNRFPRFSVTECEWVGNASWGLFYCSLSNQHVWANSDGFDILYFTSYLSSEHARTLMQTFSINLFLFLTFFLITICPILLSKQQLTCGWRRCERDGSVYVCLQFE